MVCVFWDRQGVVLVNFMSRGHDANADLRYCLISYNQQFAKSDEVFCRNVSFFNITKIFTTQHTQGRIKVGAIDAAALGPFLK